jgi:phage-related protein (TIGR01555 family)
VNTEKEKKSIVTRARATVDGWKNILTGLGIEGKDKRVSAAAFYERMDKTTAEETYAADDIAQKIVDMLPEEMVREGWCIKHDSKAFPNLESDLLSIFDEGQIMAKLEEGLRWGRLYGGAGTIIGIDDGSVDPAMPVNMADIRKVNFLNNLDRWELHRLRIQNDPTAPNFGLPEAYRIQPTLGGQSIADVHKSRILRWDGAKLPRRLFISNDYWNESVLTRPMNALKNMNQSYDAVASLLQDFAQAVFKIKNLTEMIAMGKDDLVAKRLALVDRTRSVLNAIVIEEDEEFDRKVTSLTGVPEVLKAIAQRLVMATEIPHTKLLGESPSGLGATGDSEITDWNDYVSRKQETDLKPNLTYLVKLILLSKEGPTKGVEPENWRIEFKPLYQQSQKEIQETKKIAAETDKIYIDSGVLMPDEVADSRFGGDEFSYETTLDQKLRAALPEETELEGEGGDDDGNGDPVPGPGSPPDDDGRRTDARKKKGIIEKQGSEWVLLSADRKKVLGRHKSYKKADAQLKELIELEK